MTTKSQRTIEQIQREIKMSKQESIEEIKNFLIHIQPRVGEGAFAHVWECVEYLERASVVQPALSGEAATTKEAASYIEAAEDLRAWLHEHIDVPDEIYIPFIASIERAATLRQQFMRSLPPIWDDDAKRAIDSFVNMYLAELNKQMNHSAKGSQSK